MVSRDCRNSTALIIGIAGRLVEGKEIAVKRLSKNSGQGIEEFMNEVKLIARLQHRNLIRVLGCCIDMGEKMLVYECMKHRSLDSVLFRKKLLIKLAKPFNIICGIARGLLYLHQDSRFRIIHRDLQASNILLDGQMNPKISDFGMAGVFGSDQTEENTERVVGTYGYMSPEYALYGLFSTNSDFFYLWCSGVGGRQWQEEQRFYHSNGLENMERREGIGVNRFSNSDTAPMIQPKTPGFCLGRNTFETDSSTSKQEESCTVNQVTVTTLEAR
ncbi:hypothetical protein PTKIN_Ptkin01aG0129200 [Pterospermum kingtungense]